LYIEILDSSNKNIYVIKKMAPKRAYTRSHLDPEPAVEIDNP
jgi:hypothetical protein